ncbi:MAG: Flp family type IVb pilin [Verrucomicrobiota bacterium]
MLTKIYSKIVADLTTLRSKKGQTLVEYALILALVSIVVIAVLTLLGGQIESIFNEITNSLSAATS